MDWSGWMCALGMHVWRKWKPVTKAGQILRPVVIERECAYCALMESQKVEGK